MERWLERRDVGGWEWVRKGMKNYAKGVIRWIIRWITGAMGGIGCIFP